MNNHIIHEKKSFANMRELIEWAGKEHGEKTAYSYRKKPNDKQIKKVSFLRFRDDVRHLSCALNVMGCTEKHCAVIGKFSYDWAVMYFSLLSIGAVIVPLDKEWLSKDLSDTCKKADVKFLFADEDIKGKADDISKTVSLSHETVYMLSKDEEMSIKKLTNKGRKIYSENSSLYFDADIDPFKMALLVFTSGTTGKGKGVMLSQNAILADINDAIPYIDYSGKTVSLLPPHHTYGSTVMFAGHTVIGAEIYISSGLKYITKEMKEQKPGHLALVPLYLETFYRRILQTVKDKGKEKLLFRMIKISNFLRRFGIDIRKKLFSSVRDAFGGELKTVISGGAPINPEILEFFEAIGISTLNGYGITECAPLIAFNRSKNIVPGSVGNPMDIVSIKIDDPNEEGEGEILVKGPNVMLGYYNDEDATKEAMTADGYFRTGDYGRFDKNKILYITGRKKNLIILSNGKNVYPEEIENEFTAIPGLLEIIVYEGQSKRALEYNAIVAEIFPDREYFKKNGIEDIYGYFKKYIDNHNRETVVYKKIAILKIRENEFPKNTLRKIMRYKLDMTID